MEEQEYFQFYDNHKMGIKRLDGTVVVPPEYEHVATFSDGLFLVSTGDTYTYFDVNGELLFPFENRYELYCDFSEGLAAVYTGSKYGYIDKTGKEVIAPQFDFADSFSEGLAIVRDDQDLYGAINTKGELVIDFEYPYITKFENGHAHFGDYDTWGLLDAKGTIVVPQIYPYIGQVEDHRAKVQIIEANGDYKEGVMDLASGAVEWNNNMDAVNEQNRKRADFVAKAEVLIEVLYKDGCPCERPRFRDYVQHEGSIAHVDKELLFTVFARKLEDAAENGYACRCGTVYQSEFREFSAYFGVVQLRILKLGNFSEKGSPVGDEIPFSLGMQGYDLKDIPKKYVQVDSDAVMGYLKG